MKSLILAATVLTLILSAATLRAQCSMMGGHKHASDGASHSGHAAAEQTDRVVASLQSDNVQTASIVVKGGYTPSTIVVRKGVPVRLNFDLQEKSCTGTVIFPDLDINRDLKPFAVTTIEFTPTATGTFAFSCPMNMIRGKLIVKEIDEITPVQ